ncbi:MAG: hypothetical protein JWQ76_3803 [Ramlibacter sp.]|nr:hypothetical protein [Ramlibacter sp.]
MKKGLRSLVAGVIALAAMQAGAQPAYKCSTRSGVTYSQVPCAGAREVGAPRISKSDRNAVPPQDRAHRVQRASLTPAKRQECELLDTRLVEERAALSKLPQPATPADEKALLNVKMRYRKLHC